VHPLDRYEHYRAGAAGELAPVSVHGRSPGRLLSMMSVATFGDVEIEVVTWAADSEVVAKRTARLIRARDPECYRIFLNVNAGLAPIRVVMLTLPRVLVPIDPAKIRPLVGTTMPRSLPGRTLVAEFLLELTGPAAQDDPGLAEVLRECAVGLIRQHLGNPALDPEGIARAANISPRYLYAIFRDSELTPMQLVKRLRLEEAHRRLADPAFAEASIKDIMGAVGYVRADQFARDFRQLFGASARDVQRSPGRGR
jgi:AraC-like DNA-binding protein